MTNKKILITGAAGFIGSHLVDLLISKGTPIEKLVLVVAPWDTLENLSHHPKANIVRVDIRDAKKLSKIVVGCEYVYHLAAKIDFDGKTYQEYKDVNVIPTVTLLKAAVENKVKKFIFYSSIGVHGLPAGIGTINYWNESHAPTYTNYYGKSKWEGEELVRLFHKKTGLPYTIIRPASVYGPREKGPTLALYKAITSHQFITLGDGKNKMHYVYVTDLVEATYLGAQSTKISGEYIIGGPQPEEFNNIVAAVAQSINVSLLPFKVPIAVAMPLSVLAEQAFKLIGKKAPIYPERVRTMTTTYYYNISKAIKELKYKPKVPFALGAKITGSWYRENKYV